MSDELLRDPGLLDVMQNWAHKSPTPFAKVPNLDAAKKSLEDEKSDENGMSLVFSKEVTVHLKKISTELGFTSVADFIVSATSVFGQMLGAAKDRGYTMVMMVNPDTEEVIQVPLVQTDGVRPNRTTDQ